MPTTASQRHSNDGVPALYQFKGSLGPSSWTPSLGTTLRWKRWHVRPHLAFPFLPGASSSVFLVQCWATSALAAGSQVSAVVVCWVFAHPSNPSSHPPPSLSPERPSPTAPTKAGWPSPESPACSPTSITLLLGTGVTASQPPACRAASGSATAWHLPPGCAAQQPVFSHSTPDVCVPLFAAGMHLAHPEEASEL